MKGQVYTYLDLTNLCKENNEFEIYNKQNEQEYKNVELIKINNISIRKTNACMVYYDNVFLTFKVLNENNEVIASKILETCESVRTTYNEMLRVLSIYIE